MPERYQKISYKTHQTPSWCFILLLIITSCTNPVQEIPVYVKFARSDVWQSWLSKSKQINFIDSPLPVSTGNHVEEKECLHKTIRGGIVSHHLLIAPVLMAYYKKLVKVKPEITTFFIVGPDHFRMSKARIAVGTQPYSWGKKSVPINSKAASEMIKKLNILEDPIPFKGEHSILCHIPFIVAFFPGSNIVPVIIDYDCKLSLCRQASDYIHHYMKKNPKCFFLLSIDFSHHLSHGETTKRDAVSYWELKNMNPVFSRDITCDSPKSWYVFSNTFSETESFMDVIYYTTNQDYLGKSCPDITSYFFTFLRTP